MIRPALLFRLQKKGAIVLTMRVSYFTVKNDRFVSTGFLDEKFLTDPHYYNELSELWYADPLSTKTLVCSHCGPAARALYFCHDKHCYHGLCFKCYDERLNPDSQHVNWPPFDHYQLPESGPHDQCVPHGPLVGNQDGSYVASPCIIFHILGLGAEQKG